MRLMSSDTREILCIVVVVVFVLILLCCLSISCGNKLRFLGAAAEIDQLRIDAAKVDLSESEDIMGQVTEMNREIKKNQAYNDRWWAAWAIPNGWDDLELIEIPER